MLLITISLSSSTAGWKFRSNSGFGHFWPHSSYFWMGPSPTGGAFPCFPGQGMVTARQLREAWMQLSWSKARPLFAENSAGAWLQRQGEGNIVMDVTSTSQPVWLLRCLCYVFRCAEEEGEIRDCASTQIHGSSHCKSTGPLGGLILVLKKQYAKKHGFTFMPGWKSPS